MSKSNRNDSAVDDVSFDAFFEDAEKDPRYWVSKAKLRFTESLVSRLRELEMSKGDLASRLNVAPAQVSRLCGGNNNFTLDTLVRLAIATDSEFEPVLRPKGTLSYWNHSYVSSSPLMEVSSQQWSQPAEECIVPVSKYKTAEVNALYG